MAAGAAVTALRRHLLMVAMHLPHRQRLPRALRPLQPHLRLHRQALHRVLRPVKAVAMQAAPTKARLI